MNTHSGNAREGIKAKAGSMKRHIFYVSSSYAALLYALITGSALLLCLYVGFIRHPKEILITSCGEDHYEFWPSISTTIGDMMPERQIWRAAFVLCVPFRAASTISSFNVFWQKSSRGMADLYSLRSNRKAFLSSSAFLSLFLLWVDLWRLVAALVWTLSASFESLAYHNLGFCPYIALCFLLQLTSLILVRRNRFNMTIYAAPQDAASSYALKRLCFWGESIAALGVVCCYTYHARTCADGSFSMANMFEWVFALSNIVFDGSSWYDLKQEGWWLSGSPSFYRKRWSRLGLAAKQQQQLSPQPSMTRSGMERGKNGRVGESDAAAVVAPMPNFEGSASTTDGEDDVAQGSGGQASPAYQTTGEVFLEPDVILHRFSFCSAPSRLLLWLCDIYWAHIYFEMTVHLVEHVYFMPLIAMSLSWELCSVLVLAAACLLRIGVFRRWAAGPCPLARTWLKPSHIPVGLSYRIVPMYILFYAVASLSHLHQLVRQNPRHKLLAVAIGPLVLSLALHVRFLYPSTVTLKQASADGNEDSRRLILAFPLGLVLCMLLRILFASVSPFFTDPFYGGLYGIVLGLFFTTVIYRHAMMGNTIREDIQQRAGASAEGLTSNSTLVQSLQRDGEDDYHQAVLVDIVDSSASAPYEDWAGKKNTGSASVRVVQFAPGRTEEADENSIAAIATLYKAPSPMHLGILYGCISSIGITFFTCANYIPRLLALDPFPANLIVVIVFTLGLYYSTDVLPLSMVLLQPRRRTSALQNILHWFFAGSWRRFGIFLALSTCFMLYATRQTNFTYETPHKGFPTTINSPRSDVDVMYWAVQETFWGSKYLAFLGSLGFTFCIGVLFPFVMEVTWAHQRDRRFALIAETGDAGTVISRESSFIASFELSWVTCAIVFSILYALCISYPFVPMAELLREKSRPLILVHVGMLYFTAWTVARRIRSARSVAMALNDVTVARKQRSIQFMVVLIIIFAFLWVIIGRVTMSGGDNNFPANKKTALLHQEDVLRLHKMLLQLSTERNAMTDPYTKEFERTFYTKRYEMAMEKLEQNITKSVGDIPLDPRLQLGHLSFADRLDVWGAAKAMTSFIGAIWTVHFGLDNYNVDSFARMVEQLRNTEASVIGLLESDSMHFTNGNRDMVDYISYHLGFGYTDYGPTALDNTYGCALITRYPILKVHRYVLPSPLGELSCTIHAVLDVYGMPIHTYVGHFGNTEHWADGLLQSQYLGRLVLSNPGPSLWLGYLVTHPGLKDRYQEYTDPTAPGKFRDAALEMYRQHPWTRLLERGGYEEGTTKAVSQSPPENTDFDIDQKLKHIGYLEEGMQVDNQFRRPPPGEAPRHFFYNDTGRYTVAHPRFEFIDRYCQYCLYKTGATADEPPEAAGRLHPYQLRLFDWWRIVDRGVEKLSDTEIQVIRFEFQKRV